ncbi:MAG: hypothetical protein AMXMBFR13_44360 [Phycisphaerae bacterium]
MTSVVNHPRPEKPSKPEGCPLFPHATGRWCKKIAGKLVYFGPWGDLEGALKRYQQYLDLDGRLPRRRRGRGPEPRIKKPSRPHPDYPLFPHASGRWAKKVRGRLVYFGKWDEPEAALAKWLEQKDDLVAGRTPRTRDGLVIGDLCSMFLSARRHKVEMGRLQERTWKELHGTCSIVVAAFGRNRLVDDLRPDDFRALMTEFRKGRTYESVHNQVRRAKSIFSWAVDEGKLPHPVAFGQDFHVSKEDRIREREEAGKPERLLEAGEIRALLDAASIPMRAMIYLGANAALGNDDCARLRLRHLDMDAGILEYRRHKSTVDRRATLWPETVKALKAAIDARPQPRDEADKDRVFLTRHGRPWVRFHVKEPDEPGKPSKGGHVDGIAQEFKKLLDGIGVNRPGTGFYALRHTFETVAGEIGDQAAVDRVMGHASPDMASHYRKWQADATENARLRKVTDHVRRWLFAKKQGGV